VNVNELLEKYQALLAENHSLREENEILKARLWITAPPRPEPLQDTENHLPLVGATLESPEKNSQPEIPGRPDRAEKIRLFMSLFKGREDVYAKRWQNREGRAGYAPVCRNEWKSGLCRKPAVKCFDCRHQTYNALDEKVIEAHLRGNIVASLYPLRRDEMCHLQHDLSNIHQKFVVSDQHILWYGSINLLSFGRAEESVMRLENPGIADELLGSIQK